MAGHFHIVSYEHVDILSVLHKGSEFVAISFLGELFGSEKSPTPGIFSVALTIDAWEVLLPQMAEFIKEHEPKSDHSSP